MRREDFIELDERMLAAFIARDFDLVMEHCADDLVVHDFGFEPVRGKAAARPLFEMQLEPFSDTRARTVTRLIDGNELFAEIEWTSTNTGDLRMPNGAVFPATGRTVTVRIGYYVRVDDDGLIAEMRSYPDIVAWSGQLGLIQ